MKLAEDDPLVWLLRLCNKVNKLSYLGAVADPVRPLIHLTVLLTLGVDVDLRVKAELAKTKKDLKDGGHVLVVLGDLVHKVLLQGTLDAAVEAALFFLLKVNCVSDGLGLIWKDIKSLANLRNRACHCKDRHILKNALLVGLEAAALVDEVKERGNILDLVYNGRG